MSIEVSHVTHVYSPDTPFQSVALDDVSFTVRDGEFIGLIGHTGSGKTTLVQHLNGLLKASSGKIVIDGMDLADKSVQLREVRKRVGLVFQYPEYQLFEETVLKDVCFGPLNLGLTKNEAEARAAEALHMVGLTDTALYAKSPFELSGGQKRRAAIAGVLAMKPSTLIMDEPSAGLDPRGREEILSLVQSIHSRGGVTMIMVSHSMTEVSRLCGRILVMNKGRLALDGTPAEVFAQGDVLRGIGLDLPPYAKLGERLRANGFTFPGTTLDISAAVECILENLTERRLLHE